MKKLSLYISIIILVIIIIFSVIFFTKKDNTKSNHLATLAKIGDFVNYDAGTWTQEEIDSLGEMYKYEANVQGTFGKFVAGDSRNSSIIPVGKNENKYFGWRVLKIENNIIYLIHAGTPEAYYHTEGSSFDTEKILTGTLSNASTQINGTSSASARNWSMYVNNTYATYSTIFTKEMLDQWGLATNTNTAYNKTLSDNLIKTGVSYWLSQAFNSGFVWRVGPSGFIGYYMDDTLGLRPVITLKDNIQTSGQIEQIIGTDGTTTAKVWQLI